MRVPKLCPQPAQALEVRPHNPQPSPWSICPYVVRPVPLCPGGCEGTTLSVVL